MASIFFEKIIKNLDQFISQYYNIILLGDYNIEPQDKTLIDFCDSCNVKNLVREPSCFKNHINPSCIDLILTNRSRSFQNTAVIENGISDFHKMTVTIMRSHYPKSTPNIVHYRNYSKFNNDYFRNDLKASLEKLENLDAQSFENIFGW